MARSIRFTPAAWADYTYWQTQDKKTLRRINVLIEAASREPFAGVGKPQPLLGNLADYWSRRVDGTHRLVYAVDDADFDVVACRGHYDDGWASCRTIGVRSSSTTRINSHYDHA